MSRSAMPAWDQLAWDAPLSPTFLMPEEHYRSHHPAELTRAERIALNRLEVCFTCEMLIHFELYLIRYFERYPERVPVKREARDRFVAEERSHIAAFRKLRAKIRPDLYAADTQRFIVWNAADDRSLARTPSAAFFLLAALFEEATLFLPELMTERPDQADNLVFQIFQRHADEERSHIGFDNFALQALHRQPPPRGLRWAITLALIQSERQIKAGWQRLLVQLQRDIQLDRQKLLRLRKRSMPESDRRAFESFIGAHGDSPWRGARWLSWILKKQLP